MIRSSSQQKGFTLIELVLIVLIIGILASVAIPKYVGLKQEATDGVAKGLLGTLRSANAILYTRNLAGGTDTAYTCGEVVTGATVQGDITLTYSTNIITATIHNSTYTFVFTEPTMPTTAGFVGATTVGW